MELLARLAQDPTRAAVLLDVDGVLAPIVSRPEDARVADDVRAELRRLNGRYALVACVSGRDGDDARRVVGVPALTYVGNHGLELDPLAQEWSGRLSALLAGVTWPRIENKGLTAALHFRDVPDEAAAIRRLDVVAEHARTAGFRTRYGRKVLEIIPPLSADKGTAVRALLRLHELRRALYAGDDTTDLDAFAALDELEVGVRVAVASPEGPAELLARADVVIAAQSGVFDLLHRL